MMTNQRSTLITVIVIVAAVILVGLAFSQQQAAKDTEMAETAQAAAESDQATAVANAEIAATAQAVAESNQGTAIADAEIAATKQAVAESNEGTAIANAEMAMTVQAAAESNEATAVANVESAQATATLGAEMMATVYAEMDAERATAIANYEALAATSTQTILDLAPTATEVSEKPVVYALLLYSPTCPHCHTVIEEDLPGILAEFGDSLVVVYANITTNDGSALAQAVFETFDVEPQQRAVPMMIVGDTILLGNVEIPSRLPDMVRDGLAAGGVPLTAVPGLQEIFDQMLTYEGE